MFLALLSSDMRPLLILFIVSGCLPLNPHPNAGDVYWNHITDETIKITTDGKCSLLLETNEWMNEEVLEKDNTIEKGYSDPEGECYSYMKTFYYTNPLGSETIVYINPVSDLEDWTLMN